MAKRGPPKTPTATLKARDSWRARQRGDKSLEPQSVTPPKWLTEAGRKEWDRMVPDLDANKVLRAEDATALGLLSELLATFIEKRLLRDYDRVVKMLQQFGMTPASRADLPTPKEETKTSGPTTASFIKMG